VAKKNQKESKPRTPARFAPGAQVRVKSGITVPSFEDIPLGGWAGTVREVIERREMLLGRFPELFAEFRDAPTRKFGPRRRP
jgi:hypothetical protein